MKRYLCIGLVLLSLLTLNTVVFLVHGESDPADTVDNEAVDKGSDEQVSDQPETRKKREKKKDDFNVANEDWGTYYDPQNIFCGNYDCYKILGFDYESYNKVKPTTKEITQRYRRLGREWHPDKSKHKNAKERFVKIARAYEVLTDVQVRKEYDALRYDQKAYFAKYGTSVIWKYAPKTNGTIVIIIVFLIANAISWFAQKHRWQLVADRLIKAAVEDWAPKDGGSVESKQLREEALEILAKREAESAAVSETNGTVATEATPSASSEKSTKKKATSAKAGKKDIKLSIKEKKKLEQDALLPIIKELVNEMDDFGAGFHKPTWKDLLVVILAKMPYDLGLAMIWQTKYVFRRLQKKELNDDEKEVLTARAVGPIVWSTSSDEDKTSMIEKKLWIKENLLSWIDEQEIKKLSITEQKNYLRLKKKGKVD